jgi:hypothetical protein
MKAIGEDGDRPGDIAQGDLHDGDREIEDEDAVENGDDRRVAVGRQNTRAVGIGHQRSCTLPMMYFFGTMPQ